MANENENTNANDETGESEVDPKIEAFYQLAKNSLLIIGSLGTMGGISLNQWSYLRESIEATSKYIDGAEFMQAPIEMFRLHVLATYFLNGYTREHHVQCAEHWDEWRKAAFAAKERIMSIDGFKNFT